MSAPDLGVGPTVSVRADSRRTVAPDSAVLFGVISARLPTKAEALAAAGAAADALLADLAALGGTPAAAPDERPPLSWLVPSANSYPEHDPQTKSGLTGWVTATASVHLTVRRFDLLDRLGSSLAEHESFNLTGVTWHTDPDNPVWAEVRAAAIGEAVQKGRDYAAALGGELLRLDQIADVGMLAGDPGGVASRTHGSLAFAASAGGGGGPSLVPVPQELVATIDARFTMSPVSVAD